MQRLILDHEQRNETVPPAETPLHSSPIHSTAGKVMRSRYPTEQAAGGMATEAGPEERGGMNAEQRVENRRRALGSVSGLICGQSGRWSRSESESGDAPPVSAASS